MLEPTHSSAGSATGVHVAYRTQKEIIDYIKSSGASIKDELGFAVTPVTTAPYSLGRLSDKAMNSALTTLKQVRYIAGLSDQVTLSESQVQMAQAAAFVNYANDSLSHYPSRPEGMSDEIFEMAVTGAQSSNIAWTSWEDCSLNWTIVKRWMEDGDLLIIGTVGHRRWLLNPSMGTTGFGAVSGTSGTYSAVYAFDETNTNADEYGVMWPAQNMPME